MLLVLIQTTNSTCLLLHFDTIVRDFGKQDQIYPFSYKGYIVHSTEYSEINKPLLAFVTNILPNGRIKIPLAMNS